MIGSPWTAVLLGALTGGLSGWLSRLAVGKVLNSSHIVFFSVYAGGLFARFLLLAGGVFFLRHEKYIIIIAFAASLIIVQTAFEAFPLKNGFKRNS